MSTLTSASGFRVSTSCTKSRPSWPPTRNGGGPSSPLRPPWRIRRMTSGRANASRNASRRNGPRSLHPRNCGKAHFARIPSTGKSSRLMTRSRAGATSSIWKASSSNTAPTSSGTCSCASSWTTRSPCSGWRIWKPATRIRIHGRTSTPRRAARLGTCPCGAAMTPRAAGTTPLSSSWPRRSKRAASTGWSPATSGWTNHTSGKPSASGNWSGGTTSGTSGSTSPGRASGFSSRYAPSSRWRRRSTTPCSSRPNSC